MSAVISLGCLGFLLGLFAWCARIAGAMRSERAWERLPATSGEPRATGASDPARHLMPVLRRISARHLGSILAIFTGIILLAATRIVPLGIGASLLVWLGWRWKGRRALRQHRRLLQDQVLELLEALVQPLRAGLSLAGALESAAEEVPEPLAAEVRGAVSDIRLGMPLDTVLEELSVKCGGRDLPLVSAALLQQRAAGGNLPHLLETLQRVMRDRSTLAREVRVLTAQGRLSGYLVASLPAAFLAFEAIFSRTAVQALFTRPLGWAILVAGLGLELMGLLVIRRICNLKEL